jgi:hypothetical protein
MVNYINIIKSSEPRARSAVGTKVQHPDQSKKAKAKITANDQGLAASLDPADGLTLSVTATGPPRRPINPCRRRRPTNRLRRLNHIHRIRMPRNFKPLVVG